MTELDVCQTQYYSSVKKLQDEAEILHRSVDNKTKSFNREIKKLNDLVDELESEGRVYRKECDERERILIKKLGESKQELIHEKEECKAKATSLQLLEQKLQERMAIIQNLESNIEKIKTQKDNEIYTIMESLNKEKQLNHQLETVLKHILH